MDVPGFNHLVVYWWASTLLSIFNNMQYFVSLETYIYSIDWLSLQDKCLELKFCIQGYAHVHLNFDTHCPVSILKTGTIYNLTNID